MKKIYMLLAAVLVGIASMAAAPLANPFEGKQVYIKPEAAARLKAKMQMPLNDKLAVNDSRQMISRSWYDKGGDERYYFTMFLDTEQRWCDMLAYTDTDGVEHTYTFEEFPYYLVWFQLNIISYKNFDSLGRYQEAGFIPQFTFWPCYYLWKQVVDTNWNEDAVTDKNYDIVLPMDLCNNGDYCRKFMEKPIKQGGLDVAPETNATDTNWDYWVIANQDYMQMVAENGDAIVYFTEDMLQGTTYFNGSNGSSVEFKKLVDNNELEMKYTAYVEMITSSGMTQRKTCRLPEYKGSTKVDAFEKKSVAYPIDQVHIYLDGVTGSDYIPTILDPYILPWGPVKRYYMMGTGSPSVEIYYPKDNQIEFSQNDITFLFDYSDPQNLSYFFGALYSDVNSEKPYGRWTIAKTTYSIDPDFGIMLDMVPTPGSAIPNYSVLSDEVRKYIDEHGGAKPVDKFASDDGFNAMNASLPFYLMQGSHIANGTTEGFIFRGEDQYGNEVVTNYKGNIYYHGDPSDMRKYELIPSVGEAAGVSNAVAQPVAISAADGKINVTTDSACRVNIYDLGGKTVYSGIAYPDAALAVELPGGFYVVKAGNASRKVVL